MHGMHLIALMATTPLPYWHEWLDHQTICLMLINMQQFNKRLMRS